MTPGHRPNREERRRKHLTLPRSAWPIAMSMSATPGQEDAQLHDAIQATCDALDAQVAGSARRSENRWVVTDADEADSVLTDLGVADDAHLELRAFCREHPMGRLVIAYCDYEPGRHRFTILG